MKGLCFLCQKGDIIKRALQAIELPWNNFFPVVVFMAVKEPGVLINFN